jgi:hypothetical protein
MEFLFLLLHFGPVLMITLWLTLFFLMRKLFYISKKKIENQLLLWVSIGIASAGNFYRYFDNTSFFEPIFIYAALIIFIVMNSRKSHFSVNKPVPQVAHVVFFNRIGSKKYR